MYLHVAMCAINCRLGARYRQYCWEQHQRHSRNAVGEVLVHADTLRKNPCQGLEQGHLRQI
jgi:hypothetical protein